MQRQPSGVPQSENTDMAAELYREGEGKAFRFKLWVPILHEVPKYCPYYSGGTSELWPGLQGGGNDSEADDDDDLEEPHEILSTGEDPSPEEDEPQQDDVDGGGGVT